MPNHLFLKCPWISAYGFLMRVDGLAKFREFMFQKYNWSWWAKGCKINPWRPYYILSASISSRNYGPKTQGYLMEAEIKFNFRISFKFASSLLQTWVATFETLLNGNNSIYMFKKYSPEMIGEGQGRWQGGVVGWLSWMYSFLI